MIQVVGRRCPKCGLTYTDEPAISRADNKTFICPDCGIREALRSISVPEEEWDPIIKIIHDWKKRGGKE